ncbi:MAG: TetR family transcriptional regulator [Aeromicrobium sp.]|uniref:TetR family transcriptional regulator n=1 Tax=Aeromicrobium sp. TaxID=1871063 RepID=UPI00262DCFDF|nr:TetR family transcriptional regulator [Aeromicrobium sp.]MDF1705953.1 TetR family transcriptional regulator [Aeromicrobium sp.]
MRATRETRGLSLRALARELGLSPATMSAIERDRVPVTVERTRAIAAALGTTPESLLRGEVLTAVPFGSGSDQDWRHYGDLALDPVLEAATHVFVKYGYHAATMRQIAMEAGLSPAGVYHHYSRKQELIVALLGVTMTEIRWRILAARDDGTTAVESFSLMVESLALFHAVRGDLAFLGATEMRALDEPDHRRVVALRDEVQHLLDAQVDRCFESGEFGVVNPRVAARAIATMCTSLPSWFRSDGGLSAAEVARDYAAYAVIMMR